MKLKPIADHVAKHLPDCREQENWEDRLNDHIDIAGGGELDWHQTGLVIDMVVARWDKGRKA